MNKKQFTSRGERWGMKAAYGMKWLIRQLKTLDRRYVEKARSKSWPGWIGHLPVTLVFSTMILSIGCSILLTLPLFFSMLAILIVCSNSAKSSTLSSDNEGSLSRWEDGHYEMDGFHYPDGSIDPNDR